MILNAKFLGTKTEEYILQIEDGYFKKIPHDPMLKTAIQNTIKLVRFLRCKNENLHAALKQQYCIMDSVIETSYLENFPDLPVSKYSALLAIVCDFYNSEHAGFPMKFLRDDQKVTKGQQIIENFNKENFLLHVNVEGAGWHDIDIDKFHKKFPHFPVLNQDCFHQIYELTSSVHALRKGFQSYSQLKKEEVNELDLENFSEYAELIHYTLCDLKVKYKRLSSPPSDYLELEAAGCLPKWPGSGYLFRIVCFPSNKSNNVKRNLKCPTVFVLDDENINPLNCTDKFKRVAAQFCLNCPSLNGCLSSCCHLALLILVSWVCLNLRQGA